MSTSVRLSWIALDKVGRREVAMSMSCEETSSLSLRMASKTSEESASVRIPRRSSCTDESCDNKVSVNCKANSSLLWRTAPKTESTSEPISARRASTIEDVLDDIFSTNNEHKSALTRSMASRTGVWSTCACRSLMASRASEDKLTRAVNSRIAATTGEKSISALCCSAASKMGDNAKVKFSTLISPDCLSGKLARFVDKVDSKSVFVRLMASMRRDKSGWTNLLLSALSTSSSAAGERTTPSDSRLNSSRIGAKSTTVELLWIASNTAEKSIWRMAARTGVKSTFAGEGSAFACRSLMASRASEDKLTHAVDSRIAATTSEKSISALCFSAASKMGDNAKVKFSRLISPDCLSGELARFVDNVDSKSVFMRLMASMRRDKSGWTNLLLSAWSTSSSAAEERTTPSDSRLNSSRIGAKSTTARKSIWRMAARTGVKSTFACRSPSTAKACSEHFTPAATEWIASSTWEKSSGVLRTSSTTEITGLKSTSMRLSRTTCSSARSACQVQDTTFSVPSSKILLKSWTVPCKLSKRVSASVPLQFTALITCCNVAPTSFLL
mmetsp:Transcript_140639/g.449591  ORF Transcript_140639/g.449591 Transcript_140639/m.449591 type:complete len:557 (-) Transcript_140639:1312-2982(-)